MDDPLRMYLVVLRGAVTDLDRAGALAGAAAVACVRRFAGDPALEAWRERPGKVCLRARSESQWRQVLEEPHTAAGDAVVALPPRRRSERGPVLERLQAMSTQLEPPPESSEPHGGVTYLLNPRLTMSSGKTIAQIAHAAVMAADHLADWDGLPAAVVAPSEPVFAATCARADLAAKVVDAGLTEVPPGTVTVLALPPNARPATG
ncbi:MAG TPA: aminoacyl-tRNA hydrolase [Solirubrobacteraceae bacterium]|nr:aminoacyl-tRNA hydrolase [Solirubrobacteraceae bacterium]